MDLDVKTLVMDMKDNLMENTTQYRHEQPQNQIIPQIVDATSKQQSPRVVFKKHCIGGLIESDTKDEIRPYLECNNIEYYGVRIMRNMYRGTVSASVFVRETSIRSTRMASTRGQLRYNQG